VPLEIEIVGLYEPRDPDAEYWNGDQDLLQVTQRGEPDAPIAFATAFVPAEAYPSLQPSGLLFKYEWRLWIDPDRFDADQVTQVQADLSGIRLISTPTGAAEGGTVVVLTGLPGIVDRYAAERALAESVLSIAAVGPFGLACGAMAMVAVLLARRRRSTLALARGRGASGTLVLGTQLWEAILLAGSACLVGLFAATVLVEARPSPLSTILAVAVGGAATLLLAAATWPIARRPLGQVGRDDPPVLRVSPRRLVLDLTIVAIAVGATLLLRSRGLTVAGPDDVARADPLLASVPVLSGLAAGIVALRLYPIPIRGLGWLAARRRDIVPVLGLRTISRQRAAANLPLLVLLLTAAFAAFSSVVAATLDRGQVVASYRTAGADFRVEQVGIGGLTPLSESTIPGVEALATGIIDTSAVFASAPNQRASIFFEAVDPLAYANVLAGAPVDPVWPAAFTAEPSGTGIGTAEHPIPAILSERLPAASAGIVPGDTFRIVVHGEPLTFELVERRASFPGIGEGRTFAVVPFNWVRAAFGDRPPPPSALWLRGSPEADGGLAATIAQLRESARVVSRYDAYAAIRDAPFGSAIATGFAIALVVASIYMAMTIIGAQVLSAARRARDLAYLRTLGITPSQAAGLAFVEHAPAVVLALVPGVALGVAVAILCEPGLGLATFVGASGVPLYVDWPALAVIVAALVIVMVGAVALGTWLARRARLIDALRIGED
jgi:putative ABC transport system permease protein